MVPALFVGLGMAVILGTALAVVGLWRPRGMAALPPRPVGPAGSDPRPRFSVVLRGYRMDEVDAWVERTLAEATAVRSAAARLVRDAEVSAAADAAAPDDGMGPAGGASDRSAADSDGA